MNETNLQVFTNSELNLTLHAILNDDGSISVSADDVARGLGFTQPTKSGNESIRWERINTYLASFGSSPKVGTGDYIPESLFYLLSMKATNKLARKFQAWIAMEVLPEIRKTGSYNSHEQTTLDLSGYAAAINSIHTLTQGLPNRYGAVQALLEPIGISLPPLPEKPSPAVLSNVPGVSGKTRYGVKEFVNTRGMDYITSVPGDQIYESYFAFAAQNNHDPLSRVDFTLELRNVYQLYLLPRYDQTGHKRGTFYTAK